MVRSRFRVEQLVSVQDEVAGFSRVYCALRSRFPCVIRCFIVREGTDEIDLRQIFEFDVGYVFQLTTDYDVEKLLLASS